MRTDLTTLSDETPTGLCLDHFSSKELSTLSKDLLGLMSLSGVDTNRATHYNTKEEMESARTEMHRAVFEMDRSIYGCLFCLPGITDFAKQKAVTAMLANPWDSDSTAVLTPDHERKIIDHLIWSLPANRMLNLFVDFSHKRINNSRARKSVTPKILNSGNLELWAVKYRSKIRKALEHTWGKKLTGIVRSILSKEAPLTAKENRILEATLWKVVRKETPTNQRRVIAECIAFILKSPQYSGGSYTLPLLKAFADSKEDLQLGGRLPKEILEGIRSTYHPDVKQDVILNITKGSMTSKQKKLTQKAAKKAGVVIDFNPMAHSMVELYIYAFEMGWSDEILKALNAKARKAASVLPFTYEKVGIIVDNSFSMSGSEEQKLRPMAIALSCKDMLWSMADSPIVGWSDMSGEFLSESAEAARARRLVRPSGDTNLAGALLEVLEQEPDAVFVISDGYENAPAGRFEEVLHLVRNQAKIDTPIYHLNPVGASESKLGVRQLAKEVPVMAVSNPEAIGLSLFVSMLEVDPKRGIQGIVSRALPFFSR